VPFAYHLAVGEYFNTHHHSSSSPASRIQHAFRSFDHNFILWFSVQNRHNNTSTIMKDCQSLNSSCSSSMASFMSGLLKESSSRLELNPNQSLVIDIVNDNARKPTNNTFGMNRAHSLVTMRRSRSGQRICRWSAGENEGSGAAGATTRGTPRGRALRKGNSISKADPVPKRANSDTMLLHLPTKREEASPRITSKTLADGGRNKNRSANAIWSNEDVPESQQKPFNNVVVFDMTTLHLSAEGTIKPKPNMFLDKFSTTPLTESHLGHGPVALSSWNNLAIKNNLLVDPPTPAVEIQQMKNAECSGAPIRPTRRGSMEEIDKSMFANYKLHEQTILSTSRSLAESSGLSSSQSMNRIRDSAALGTIQMPRSRQSHNSLAPPKKSPPRVRSSGMGNSAVIMGARRKQSFLQDPSVLG
jgi:hypothetical protein